jgi:alanine racemase
VRRDDRHRHEPARACARRDRLLDGLAIDTLHSHLACADEDHAMNAVQRERFRGGRGDGPGEALQPRQFGRHLPGPRL